MSTYNSQTLSAGAAVMTKDGTHLGSVKEVTAKCFKVDAPFHKDYWLSMDFVETTNDTGVVLELSAASVAEHRLDSPELAMDEDPMQAIVAKPVITDDELLEQRAKMERELAEQSRALPEHEPSPTEMRGPRAYERIPADHSGFNDLRGEYVPNAPVQDRIEGALLGPDARGSLSGVIMLAAPIVIGSAAMLGGFMLVRKLRRSRAERAKIRMMQARELAMAGARDFASAGAHDLREAASNRMAHRPHIRPMLRRGAKRGMKTGRHLAHDGLIAAANKIE